ncbi:unnamed protein product, partial [Cuscuta europaea]
MAFLDGSIEQPSTDNSASYAVWYRINALLLSWLIYSIAPELRSTFFYFTVAKELWDEIKLRYGKSDGPRLFYLEKTLGNISQGTQTITAYYNFFKGLWDEYVDFKTLPPCSCSLYTCKIHEKYQKLLQKESVQKFLVGLNESYSHLRSQILLQKPCPNLSSVYSFFLQEESQRTLQYPANSVPFTHDSSKTLDNSFNDSTAFLAKNQNYKKKSSVTCNHCGYQGHFADRCFQIIGYPPNWKGPKGHRTAPGFQQSSYSHKNTQAHLANASVDSSSNDMDLCDPSLYNKFLEFIKGQHEKASANVAMVVPVTDQSPPSDSNFLGNHSVFLSTITSIIWILDTGASDHMNRDFTLYTSTPKPISIKIQLPTGFFITATHIGNVRLNNNLTLHNVLYVPKFNFNLISISSLALHENISVHFSSNHATLQDHHTNTMIGYADLKNGLYLYNSTDSSTHNKSATVNHVHSQCSDSKYDIWHYRLGHLPFNKLNAIVDCNVSHHINKDTACDICHFAKQK